MRLWPSSRYAVFLVPNLLSLAFRNFPSRSLHDIFHWHCRPALSALLDCVVVGTRCLLVVAIHVVVFPCVGRCLRGVVLGLRCVVAVLCCIVSMLPGTCHRHLVVQVLLELMMVLDC